MCSAMLLGERPWPEVGGAMIKAVAGADDDGGRGDRQGKCRLFDILWCCNPGSASFASNIL